MEIHVDMRSFKKNFIWNEDTVHYGNKIAQTKGKFFTFDGETYKNILNDCCVFYTAT